MSGGGNIVSFKIASTKNKGKYNAFSFLNNLSLISISNNLVIQNHWLLTQIQQHIID